MRILYITPFFQHPTMQGPTRHYYFIRELSRRHAITLLTPLRTRASPEAMKEMASYTERILAFETFIDHDHSAQVLTGVLSKFSKKLAQAHRMRKAIKEMKLAFLQLVRQGSFDLVLFHGKSLFSLIEDLNDLPIVVDFCDATSTRITGRMRHADIVELPWLMLQYLHVRRVEKKLIRKTPYLAFISSRDRDAMLDSFNGVKVLPLGMDLGYWTRKTNNPESNCIMYSGGMNYPPNVDGALYLIKEILPLVRQRIPRLRVLIVGRDPVPELIEAAKPYPDVTITGSVDDMRAYFEKSVVYAAPLRFGSGLQNKLLEAMAMEVPVVTTPVAAAGLRVDTDQEIPLLVAEETKQFADSIVRLLMHENERNRLAAEGRLFIENHFVWSRSAEILEQMCVDAVKQGQQGRLQAVCLNSWICRKHQ